MEAQRNDDPFNPEFREEKKFLRESNRKKIYMIIIITALFAYGAKEFIYGETIDISVYNAKGTMVETIRITPGENFYYIVNESPWKIILIFTSNIDFTTNYDGTKLISGQVVNTLFYSNQTGIINVSWVKK